MSLTLRLSVVCVLAIAAMSCSGGGSSGDGSGSGSGQASIIAPVGGTAADAASVSAPLNLSRPVRPHFSTVADTVLTDATVQLIEIEADGSESTIESTTTDDEGMYSF